MMKITHSLSVDLQHSGSQNTIYAKQGDRLTREVTINLFNGGSVWTAPSEVAVLQLAYCKSDKVGGCYDHMPDGSVAGRFNSARTAVTMQLHPQVLNVAGNVFCELRLLTNAGEILNTFNFIVNVQKSPIAMTLASEGYYNNVFDGGTFIPHISPDGTVSWTNNKNLPNPAPVNVKGPKGDTGPQGPKGDPGETASDAVKYTAQNLTDEQKAQARENIGAADMEAVEAAAEAADAAAEAVDNIPQWAKQPTKPDYQANEIDCHMEFLGQEVRTVDDALAAAEDTINDKLDNPEVLTWDAAVYPTLLDFLKTITVPGRYKFVDPIEDTDCEYELVLSTADEPCYFGKLQCYTSGFTGTRMFVAVSDISGLCEEENMRPATMNDVGSKRSTISIRLLSDMWDQIDDDVYEQTVNVSELDDVDDDEDVLLQCCPAPQSISAWNAYGVQCVDAASGTLTFRADVAPSENENISVVVAMWR